MSAPAKVAVKKLSAVPALHRMRVELTNGAMITLRSVSPRPYLKLTRDSYNNPLWTAANGIGDTIDDDSGRLARFNDKFGMAASPDAWNDTNSSLSSLVGDVGMPTKKGKKKDK